MVPLPDLTGVPAAPNAARQTASLPIDATTSQIAETMTLTGREIRAFSIVAILIVGLVLYVIRKIRGD